MVRLKGEKGKGRKRFCHKARKRMEIERETFRGERTPEGR